jgi:hypothetical protein
MFMNSEDNTGTWEQDVNEGCIVQTEGIGCNCRAAQGGFKEQGVTAELHSAGLRYRM